MDSRPRLPQDRTLLADLLNRQMNRIALLEREIAELMDVLDKLPQMR